MDSPEDSRDLAKRLDIPFPLLSDPDLATASAYGVAMKGRDIDVPSVFVVARDEGSQEPTIRWRYVGESMIDRPALEAVLEALPKASR